MTDTAAASKGRAAALAEWTQLSDEEFGKCYVAVVGSRPALDWTLVVAMGGANPKRQACEEAERADFLDELARKVANVEHLAQRRAADIAGMLREVRSYGVMQGMTDQQRGLLDANILMSLQKVSEACAMVVSNPGQAHLGSAFLVRDDLVLTAAHVVMDVDLVSDDEPCSSSSRPTTDVQPDTHQWASRLKEGLAFRFKARENQPRHHMVEVLPAANEPLVCFALPHGRPPNHLEQTLDELSGKNLDFALVRLAQRVGHVSPVEIAEGAAVKKGKLCWSFGYPGGNAIAMGVDIVTDVHEESGRWLHLANAAAGMSGGCCANHEGHVAGLHEGTLNLVAGGAPTMRNRGVSIGAIRKEQRRSGNDPLELKISTLGIELQDAMAVDVFYRVGKRLAGDEHAGQWRVEVKSAFGGIDPEVASSLPAFHPWFARTTVDAWLKDTDANERLCLIHGEAGTGKSFCARLLKEMLDPRKTDLLVFSPTQIIAMDWSDAISQLLVPEESDYRTAAASIRYRDFDQVIREIRRRSTDAGRTCYLVFDFGPGGDGARFVGTQWVEFVAALAGAEAIRVMLIGLDEFERAAMIDRLAARPETENVGCHELEVLHLRQEEFRTYIKALAAARGWPLSTPDLTRVVASVYRPDAPLPENMRTLTATLAAIKFEAEER